LRGPLAGSSFTFSLTMDIEQLRSRLQSIANWLLLSRCGLAFKWLWRHVAPPIVFSRVIFGNKVFFNLRDNLFFLYSTRKHLETHEGIDAILAGLPPGSRVWDVGCNVGIYALHAARLGHNVVAFDLSPKAIQMVQKSASENNLRITCIPRALHVWPEVYYAPRTAYAGNKLTSMGHSSRLSTSITWMLAAEQFGIPDFIKLDIEGLETEFLKNPSFCRWIRNNGILLEVEVHNTDARIALEKSFSNFRMLSNNNFLIVPLPFGRQNKSSNLESVNVR